MTADRGRRPRQATRRRPAAARNPRTPSRAAGIGHVALAAPRPHDPPPRLRRRSGPRRPRGRPPLPPPPRSALAGQQAPSGGRPLRSLAVPAAAEAAAGRVWRRSEGVPEASRERQQAALDPAAEPTSIGISRAQFRSIQLIPLSHCGGVLVRRPALRALARVGYTTDGAAAGKFGFEKPVPRPGRYEPS